MRTGEKENRRQKPENIFHKIDAQGKKKVTKGTISTKPGGGDPKEGIFENLRKRIPN